MGVVAVVGPTAASKSRLAMALARELGGEIVSVDSMQVYRGLDIGTAKPSPSDQALVRHHLIDVVEPEQTFTVAEHQRLGVAAIEDISARGLQPVVTGGSGLHFRALVDPLDFPPSDGLVRAEIDAMQPEDAVASLLAADPAAGEVVDLANPRRVARAVEIVRLTGRTPSQRAASRRAQSVRNYEPRLPLVALGIDPGDALARRAEERFDAMLEAGLFAEVTALAPRLGLTASQGVGYKELLPAVRGEVTLGEAREAAIRATVALAKRQRTFFKRDPRIHWIPWHDDPGDMLDRALAVSTKAIRETMWTS